MRDPFSLYPDEHLTEQQATLLAKETEGFRSLVFDRVEATSGGYVVCVAYNGGKMTYNEPGGRKHRLRPGMLKISGFREWADIQVTLRNGVSAEFL